MSIALRMRALLCVFGHELGYIQTEPTTIAVSLNGIVWLESSSVA